MISNGATIAKLPLNAGGLMDYVYLGRSGLQVSRFCLGTMTYGDWEMDEASSLAVIERVLDAGINLLAGYQLQKNLLLSAKFDLGIINISPSKNDIVYHTRSFAVSVGYLFGEK